MSGKVRRRQLIEVAIDLFSRKGFAGTTTKEIAKSAGVTEAIVFRHFVSKRELYVAILEHINSTRKIESFLLEAQRLMNERDDVGLIRFIVSKIIASIRQDPRFERLMILAAMEGNELAELHMQQFALPIGTRIHEYFSQRQREGALADGDPDAMLMAVAGAAHFYAMRKYVFAFKKPSCREATDIVETLTSLVSHGLLKQIKGEKK